MTVRQPRIEIGSPRVFTGGAVVAKYAYGLLLVVPVLVALLIISVMPGSILTLVIPVLPIAAMIPFLPLCSGSPLITRLVDSLGLEPTEDPDACVVQLTLQPRLCHGLRALADDADDFGRLRITATELVFEGDAVQLHLPYEEIREVRLENAGFRGLFVRMCIEVVPANLPQAEVMVFSERSEWLLSSSQRLTGRLYQNLYDAVRRRSLLSPGE